MRIRTTKPEFWRSGDISCLEWEERLLFIGLWSYVDDNGVGVDKLSFITADLFADDMERDPTDTLARVSRGLQTLFEAGRIVRYTLDDKPLLYITNWLKHQRIDKPNKKRYDPPTGANLDSTPPEGEDSRHSRETLAPGAGEQGNRGTGEQGNVETSSPAPPPTSSPSPPGFDEFWQAYPRKVGKQAAIKRWHKAIKITSRSALIQGALRLAQDPNRSDEYTPHPSTWLNEGRWDDDPLPSRDRPLRSTTDERVAAVQALKNSPESARKALT